MKKYLFHVFEKTAEKLEYLKNIELILEVPANEEHGDFSTNAAMMLTKKLKRNPREVASEIINNFEFDKSIVYKVEIAGPGFINFYFTSEYISKFVSRIIDAGKSFGKSDKYNGKRANVEFVSANPTGPLTVGHGRNAVAGDTIANMLEWIGYKVDREYYFNNAGRQMRVLGDSVRLRYLELLGQKVEFPEDYYQGEYIKDIAADLFEKYKTELVDETAEGKFKEFAEKKIFENIEQSLKKLNINIDKFFNEKDLYVKGEIEDVLNKFKEKNLSYESEGAVWLKLTELGGEQDKVIVKSSGEPTYRLPDIAYHVDKFGRGYDLLIDIFGSDHSATYPDVVAGLKALGYESDNLKVLIHQFVTIMEKGEVVKMSTRKANFITLDELTEEVGSDVVRYFFNMRNISSHMNFDLDLAKKQSDENPVFYLQYAHARISSILRMTDEQKLKSSTENLNLLATKEEQRLIKKLSMFEDEVLHTAQNFEPNRIATYLEELAAIFHKFYTECRIIGSEEKLAEARIALVIATRVVLRNGLSILGVSAPDKM